MWKVTLVGARFQELDWRSTPWGEISLRCRWDPVVEEEVYEIKLNDEFLMSSLFTVGEVEMARLALAGMLDTGVDVVVGGLGLGYTAKTVLESPAVRSLTVVEALSEVIEWHERGLIPTGAILAADPRCEMVRGDFFGMLRHGTGLDPREPDRQFHAIILDIDHSPQHVLHPSHAEFYRSAGLQRLAERLCPGGVFALWSNDAPDRAFIEILAEVFAEVRAETISFDNPLQGRDAANTIYLSTLAISS